MEYLQKNLYFQWMQLVTAILSNWKNIIEQNKDINTFTIIHHLFIQNSRVLMAQKVTSNELYWVLITTTYHKSISQKYFEKKIH